MKTGTYKFNRLELAGSLGDLGTLLPLSIAMIIILKLSVTTVFFMMGLFYIFSGLYFRLPIPVQPLKVVSAIAIAYPSQVSLSVLAASGIIFGFIMLFLSFSGLIDRIAKFFTKPVIRGIQLGLGFILINRAVEYITEPRFNIRPTACGYHHFRAIVKSDYWYRGKLHHLASFVQ